MLVKVVVLLFVVVVHSCCCWWWWRRPLSGEPIFRYRTAARQFPVEAGSWNHRCEAIYKAAHEQPNNGNVAVVVERGLKAVKFVHTSIPPRVWARFISTHNTFHSGSGINYMDHLDEATQLEAAWEHDCSKSGLHSANPRYRTFYRDFVLKKRRSFAHSKFVLNICCVPVVKWSKPVRGLLGCRSRGVGPARSDSHTFAFVGSRRVALLWELGKTLPNLTQIEITRVTLDQACALLTGTTSARP